MASQRFRATPWAARTTGCTSSGGCWPSLRPRADVLYPRRLALPFVSRPRHETDRHSSPDGMLPDAGLALAATLGVEAWPTHHRSSADAQRATATVPPCDAPLATDGAWRSPGARTQITGPAGPATPGSSSQQALIATGILSATAPGGLAVGRHEAMKPRARGRRRPARPPAGSWPLTARPSHEDSPRAPRAAPRTGTTVRGMHSTPRRFLVVGVEQGAHPHQARTCVRRGSVWSRAHGCWSAGAALGLSLDGVEGPIDRAFPRPGDLVGPPAAKRP